MKAVEKGLALTPLAQERIELLHKAHKKYWHRYPPDEACREPDWIGYLARIFSVA